MTLEDLNRIEQKNRDFFDRMNPSPKDLDLLIAEVRRLQAELETRFTEEDADLLQDHARAEEREACAKLVHQRYEEVDSETGIEGELLRLEDAIRARSSPKAP